MDWFVLLASLTSPVSPCLCVPHAERYTEQAHGRGSDRGTTGMSAKARKRAYGDDDDDQDSFYDRTRHATVSSKAKGNVAGSAASASGAPTVETAETLAVKLAAVHTAISTAQQYACSVYKVICGRCALLSVSLIDYSWCIDVALCM